MLKLALKLVLAGAAVWAIWSFVPVAGRPLAERWEASGGSPLRFAEETWAAVRGAPAPAPPRGEAREPGRSAPQGRDRASVGPAEAPVERLTESDRRALDRLLAEKLSGSR